MKAVLSIAANTLKEAVRKKHIYVLALIAVMLIGFSSLIVFFQVSPEAFMKELSLFTVSFLGMLVAVFVAAPQIRREMNDRSLYTVLAKPVSRFGYVVGKYLGALLAVAFSYAIFSIIFYVFLQMKGIQVTGVYLHALALNFIQLCIIAAAAMFLSTLFTASAAATLAIFYYIAQYFSFKLSYPLQYFNINWTVVHNVMPVPICRLLPLFGMGIAFALGLLFLSTVVFAQKEL
jgi:ABC-type transport system involved in multi-copper enzyme maturation permease subunit